MIEKWECPKCGLKLRNVVLPVRHKCKVKGLGDVIAKVTKFFGIKECGGCKKRREALNKAFPSRNSESEL